MKKDVNDMSDLQNTQIIGHIKEMAKPNVSDVLAQVYSALVEKGYNPIKSCQGIPPISQAIRTPEA